MLIPFIRWFYAPTFPEDEGKTRRALLLNAIINACLVVAPALLIGLILGGATTSAIVLICIWLLTLGSRLMMLSGRVAKAGMMMVIGILAGTTLIVYAGGTIRAPATSLYILAIVIAGLSIHRRAIIWTTLFSSMVVFLLWIGERNDILPAPSPTVTIIQVIAFTVTCIAIAFLLSLAVKNIDEALWSARQELSERILAREREFKRRVMMEKVIRIGKTVTAQTPDLRIALNRIWDGVRNGLDFDRVAIFLYDPTNNSMQGSYRTDRSGWMSEEWDMRFGIDGAGSFFRIVLSQPDGYYFTQDYAGERNLSQRPGHPMEGVKHYAAVAVWAGDKPAAIICVDQLTSGRVIMDEQLEALRLFAGYAGLAIENARLNAELKERAQERENFIQELGNRNAELERFTYTVSHDLRSPLVTIKGFLGMLNKDLQENRPEKVQNDLQRIAGAADKMGDLLSDLLELSRIGRIINPPEEVDSARLIQDALDSVDARLRSKNVTVNILPDLPKIYGDRIRLREVFENLIDNAAKYMGGQTSPVIEIGAKEQNGECIFYVKDNGMGIEPAYQTRIFSLFEKLNPASEGTGIGLTLVKRIIETHGGRVWVESDGFGMGAVFWFAVPVQ